MEVLGCYAKIIFKEKISAIIAEKALAGYQIPELGLCFKVSIL